MMELTDKIKNVYSLLEGKDSFPFKFNNEVQGVVAMLKRIKDNISRLLKINECSQEAIDLINLINHHLS